MCPRSRRNGAGERFGPVRRGYSAQLQHLVGQSDLPPPRHRDARPGSGGLRPRPRFALRRRPRLRPRLAAVARRGDARRRRRRDVHRRGGRAARVRVDRNGVDREPADAPPRRNDAASSPTPTASASRCWPTAERSAPSSRPTRPARATWSGWSGRPPANSSSTTTADACGRSPTTARRCSTSSASATAASPRCATTTAAPCATRTTPTAGWRPSRDIAGSDWRYLYRDDGLLGGAVDPEGRTYLAAAYDAAGRAVRAFGGRLHEYAYAPEGTTVAEATGEVHALTRNDAGTTTALESTTGVSWSLTLDAANRVSTLTLPERTIGYAYGGHGKVATMTVADSVSGTTRAHSYDYDAQGRLNRGRRRRGGCDRCLRRGPGADRRAAARCSSTRSTTAAGGLGAAGRGPGGSASSAIRRGGTWWRSRRATAASASGATSLGGSSTRYSRTAVRRGTSTTNSATGQLAVARRWHASSNARTTRRGISPDVDTTERRTARCATDSGADAPGVVTRRDARASCATWNYVRDARKQLLTVDAARQTRPSAYRIARDFAATLASARSDCGHLVEDRPSATPSDARYSRC